jgi:hypothetical protein
MKIKIRCQKADLSTLALVLEKVMAQANGTDYWVDVMQEDDYTLIVTAMEIRTGKEILGSNG